MAEIRTEQITDVQITTKDLSVFYGEARALENVNLEVRRGEFVSLLGESGSGKTTLLNALAGFIPSTGRIFLEGKVGVVFQDYSVFPSMTVSQNIAFGLENGHRTNAAQILQKHLKLIGLENYADKYPAELSGGEMQRVGIARALAANPDVLLMDEPYGALDRQTRDRMQKWLLDVWSESHKTVIFITHDIEEAIFLSDRVLILKNKTVFDEYSIPFDRPRSEEIKFSLKFVEIKRDILSRMFE